MNLNRRPISEAKVACGKTKKTARTEKELPDEELKKLVRRAVKNVCVPAGFESRLLRSFEKRA